jgi:ABC-type transport system involved in multi-copper enzyme maturation permease subunit
MLGITDYFWRLIPANPILLRVVESGGKRKRDLAIRSAYLGLLIVVVILSMGGGGGGGLEALAKTSARIFQHMSYLQLALVALLAPVFTAGAITQERDSQTYDILLSTPLTNGQIVLGSLLSRLFFVIALLISGIPIFSITQIFGGVAIRSIALSFGIAAATAFVTGALAMAIATFKVGTRRTIFSFYLFIVLYLMILFLLDQLEVFKVMLGTDPQTGAMILSDTSWLTGLHPFLALRVIFNDPAYLPPDLGALPEHLRRWPVGWYLTSPHGFYISFMLMLSMVLVLPSVVLLRRLAQSSNSFKSWLLQMLRLSSGDRRRRPRSVWFNPIAWREARTKASAARATVLRYGFIGGGLAGALILVVMHGTTETSTSYITRTSYDPGLNTLAVVTGDRATTYTVTPLTTVTLNGNSVTMEELRGRRLDVSITTDTSRTRLMSINAREIGRRLSAENARMYLLGLVLIEFAVILLIVTNAAASTVTREKEDGSLDLLLATPITSRYYIWGKLRGLVSYVLPLVAVPVASVLMFVVYDSFRLMGQSRMAADWVVVPESVLIMPGMLIIVAAFASILGMHMSLRCGTTVRAVMSSVGIVVGIAGVMGWCGFALLNEMRSEGGFALIVGSFSPFTLLTVLIDPWSYGGRMYESGISSEIMTGRVLVFIFSWLATAAYAVVVWTMYKSMVTNFDMTIRRQSR